MFSFETATEDKMRTLGAVLVFALLLVLEVILAQETAESQPDRPTLESTPFHVIKTPNKTTRRSCPKGEVRFQSKCVKPDQPK